MWDAAEADGVRHFEETLEEDPFVDANEETCVKASSVGEVHEL